MNWTDALNKKWPTLSQRAFTAIALSLALGSAGTFSAARAESVTPQAVDAAADSAPQCESPEGSFLYTVSIPGLPDFQGIETYSAGGGYSEADQLSFSPYSVASAGHGAWKKTGPKTFLLTYLNLTFDAYSSGNPTGTLVVRQKTTLDKSGNSYTGSGDYAYYGTNGQPVSGGSGTFTIKAKRIVVQAPK